MDVYENVSKAANVWWSPVVPSSQLDHLASQNPAGAGHVVHDEEFLGVPRDTHKSEAIPPSLTLLVFEHFLPSSTLWLSPNCSASAARADRGAF